MKILKMSIIKTQVTELETEVLEAIRDAEHTFDGFGMQGHLEHTEWDMTKYRGVIGSLVKKGIIDTELMTEGGDEYSTWCSVKSKYQIEDKSIEWGGYDFHNIEFPSKS